MLKLERGNKIKTYSLISQEKLHVMATFLMTWKEKEKGGGGKEGHNDCVRGDILKDSPALFTRLNLALFLWNTAISQI